MSDLVISDPLRDLLAVNLLEERDLAESVGLADIEEVAGRPGLYACRCMVPVRRAFDPETAELKRLDLKLKRLDADRWQVESIDGLEDPTAPDGP